MASYATSVSSPIQDDLTKTIDIAIATKNDSETNDNIRSLALETIRDLRHSWSAPSRLASGALRADHDIVDKLHFVYTAAQRLHQHRYQPDGLPTKITSCFTKHIQSRRELTVGAIEEILKGALAVERLLLERMKAAEAIQEPVFAPAEKATGGDEGMSTEATGETTSRVSKKRKSVYSSDEDQNGDTMTNETAASKSQKKRKNSGDRAVIDAGSVEATGEVAPRDVPVEDAGKAGLDSTVLTTPPEASKSTGSPAKSTQKVGPGNRNHEHSTKWYPDEEQFMRDLMTSNVNWTFQQYSDANTARFKGTYYVDSTDVQQPGMREGRTSNAIRLRLGTFRSALKGGQRASAGSAGEKNSSGGSGGGEAVGGTRITANYSASPKSLAEPAALVIYASGKLINRGEGRTVGSSTEYNNLEPFDGADVGEDEDPLGDLEEMASGVEAGKL